MSDTNSQAEGLRIALEMELRGYNLYLRARDFTEDAAFRALLNSLAGEEKRHHAQFQAMLDSLGFADAAPDEQALAAARAADTFFPGSLMKIAMDGALDSMEAFLGTAIKSEAASVSFYGNLLDLAKDETQKDVLRRIIHEETAHLHALTARQSEAKEANAT